MIETLERFLKTNTAKGISLFTLIAAAFILFYNGCGNTANIDLSNLENSIELQESLTQANQRNEFLISQVDRLTEEASSQSELLLAKDEQLEYQTGRKEYYKSLLDNPVTELLYKDTCFNHLTANEQAQNEIERLSKINATLEKNIASLTYQNQKEKENTDQAISNLADLKSSFLNLSAQSSFYDEKAFIQLKSDGTPFIRFMQTQSITDKIIEDIDLSFNPYYRWSFEGGWGMNADFGDFSNYQLWYSGINYRATNRFSLGLFGTYADRNVIWHPTNSNQLTGGVRAAYHFNFGKRN